MRETQDAAAWAAILEAAAQLRDAPASGDASFARGLAGEAVFLARLDRALPRRGFAQRAMQRVDACVEALQHAALGPGLHSGIAGVCWSIRHVSQQTGEALDDAIAPFLAEIDALLLQLVERGDLAPEFDVIGGLAGICAYAVTLSDAGMRRRLCASTSAALAALLPPRAGDRAQWDLGLAHGVSGVLAGVACAARVEALPGSSLVFIRALAHWLEGEARDMGATSYSYRTGESVNSRLAWCYGDLGAAIAFHQAGTALRDAALTARAVALASSALSRPEHSCGIVDAGLCHGAMGAAHIARQLHRATGDARFAERARHWARHALQHWTASPEAPPGFLEGWSGTATAMLDELTGETTGWAAPLLTDLKPCAARNRETMDEERSRAI